MYAIQLHHNERTSRGDGFTIGTDFLESPLRNKKENTLYGDSFYLSDRPSLSISE